MVSMLNKKGTQTTLLTLLLVLAVISVVVIAVANRSSEAYSPYGSRERTGYPYLDIYETQDYYREHPYIYPTPYSYLTAWYKLEREQQKYFQQMVDRQEKLLIEEL